MFIELLVGVGATALVVYLYNISLRNSDAKEEKELPTPKDSYREREETLEQKIRKAEYEAYRNKQLCEREIADYCRRQLEVLEEVCTPSHIELSSKTLFFLHRNPLNDQRVYFYERDITERDATLVEKAKSIARGYDQHLQLFFTKLQVFTQLHEEHTQNLARLKGMQQQNQKFDRLHRHQEHLERLDAGEGEKNLSERYQQRSFLDDIEETLEAHETFLQQYFIVAERYKGRESPKLEAAFQKDLQELLQKMQSRKIELPSKSKKEKKD